MEKFEELSFEEKNLVNGGGPISKKICEWVKDCREWIANYEPSNEKNYLTYKMAGL